MAEAKTKPGKGSITQFINQIENKTRQADSEVILKMMKDITKTKATLWGTAIVGFGSYHYEYASGCEGDWMKIGFSPRKSYISVYLLDGFDKYQELLEQLGKHKRGKSCLNINKLADVDVEVLEKLIRKSFEFMTEKFG